MLVTAQAVAALLGAGGVVAATSPARDLLGAWIIVGSAFWAAGMGITVVRAIAGDPALPHPGHLLWLISLVLALIGTVRRPGPHRDYVGPFLALDIVLVASAWLLLVWRLAIWRPGMDSLTGVNWAALLVLFMDLLMCATVVQLMTDIRTKSMITMSIGTMLLVAADAVAAATEGSQPGNLLRLILVIGGAVLTFAGVASANGSPVTSSRPDDSRVRQVLAMALVITAIVGYMVAMSGHSTDTVSRLAAVLVLGCFGAREVYRGRRGRALLAQLGEQALTDPLTGLSNRRALTEALHAAADSDAALCVVSIDVDRFKDVNQHLGHEVGDRVLTTVARVLRQHCPGIPFRLGGDEFAVLTPLTEEEAVLGAEGLRQLSAEAFAEIPGIEPLSITLSIGIAGGRSGADGPDPLEVLTRSGQALRVAKLDRDRVRLYSDEDARRLEHRALLEQRLRHAMTVGGITFAFQPIVDLADGRAVGVETLARWDDEVLGQVSPVEFVPVAEQIGVVHELGRQALKAGIDLAVQLARHGRSLGMSVNVSPVQLRRASFAADLAGLLNDAGVAESLLTLEVTEGVFIDLDDPAVHMLHRLAESGIAIAIDDFGTGYSSLGYMTRLPASIVKLDRSLTQRVEDPRTRSVIEAMLGVASAHDIVLIMEGVESPLHADLLSRLGVRLAQGWLWAKAMPADELIRWVTSSADATPRRRTAAARERPVARHRAGASDGADGEARAG